MKLFLFSLLILVGFKGISQTYTYRDKNDSTVNCYLTILPENEIKGLIVRDYSSLPPNPNDPNYPYKWRDLALENGFAILYTVTSKIFPALYYSDECLFLLDDIIHEVVENHEIPKQNIFIGGISSSGTRALKYAQFCEMRKSKYEIKINGVFAVDSPLDYERFYRSAVEHKHFFTDGMLWEANLVPGVFEEQFGGSAYDFPEKYQKASVYSYRDSLGGNANHLTHTSLLFFHEPDIDWWIQERGATYYDINSFDIAGLVNQLNFFGHQDVESIATSGKGFDREGNRKCHSWTIVDEVYLVDWILKRLK